MATIPRSIVYAAACFIFFSCPEVRLAVTAINTFATGFPVTVVSMYVTIVRLDPWLYTTFPRVGDFGVN